MKIRSLSMEHFRKFTDPVTLAGLTDGVNVLAECNEFGKSTILAAIRGVLFERHGSKAQSVASMQHWTNKTSPVIALEFELAGQVYRIEKRFLHREPYAKLTMPNGAVHQGDAAEERLQQVLNFSRAGKTGSKPEDIGMWGALWVTQRQSVDQPGLPDSARQTIHGCLDEEVGALAGGTRGRVLLTGVRGELARIENGNGKPVGRYKEGLAELERASGNVVSLEEKRRSLAKDIEDLDAGKRTLARADGSGEEKRHEEMLAEARDKREAAQRYEDREKQGVMAVALVQSHLAEAQKEVEARSELQSKAVAAANRATSAVGKKEAAERALAGATSALDRQRERVRGARERSDEASHALRRARAAHDLALSSHNLLGFERRLALAEAAQSQANAHAARLLAFTVTGQSLGAVRNAAAELRKTQSALEAQATLVTLDLLPGAAVRVHGSPDTRAPLTVIEDLVVEIEGVGTIRIQPGIRNRDSQLALQGEQQRLLGSALAAAAAETLEQAEQQYAERVRCETDLAQADREVTSHTPADPAWRLAGGIDALRNRAAVLRAGLEAGLAAAQLEAAPELAGAREAMAEAEQGETELSGAAAVEQAPVPELEQSQERAVRAHAEAESELRAAERDRESLKLQQEQALQREPAEALAGRRAAAAAALLAQQGLLEEVRRTRPADSAADMDSRIARYERARQQFTSERTQTRQQIAILESRIEREEGIGIEEQLAEAERTRDDLDLECARFQRELKVLQLLRDTLEEAEQQAKERYMAPVLQRVTPYLQRLFPGAAIHCDENFQITGVVRELGQAERFEGLSDGTQEQIAVLARLAFADMLIENGRPAMVILDDALAYSDSERLERMFDLLAQASARMQILILTCRGELFTRLGGKRLRVG